MLLNVRSGWAHYRATTAEFHTRRRTIRMPGICSVEGDDKGAGDGGGGGGDQKPDDKGKGGGDDDKGKAAQDKKLSDEAAGWRVKYRDTEKTFTEYKTAKETELDALKSQLSELESRISATPQGDDKGKGKGTPDPELVKLQRTVKELSDSLKTVREERDKDRTKLRTEKIQRRVSELTAEGKFAMPKVFGRLLTEKITIAEDDALVLNVPNEVGGTDQVPATLENLMKYHPVDDFDQFVESKGSNGSGGRGGDNRGAGDGIDWAKVNSNDLDYISKHMDKINAAIARGDNK